MRWSRFHEREGYAAAQMVSTVPEGESNGNEENTLTPLPAPHVQCTVSIPLHYCALLTR